MNLTEQVEDQGLLLAMEEALGEVPISLEAALREVEQSCFCESFTPERDLSFLS